ncbi:MAG TPA: TlpA disulfide reductase family protein [Dehalococcoidia bacterium]|nr:TlpA disulfide reductase family protein [Dehalococcoidia bacterium]
MATSTRLAFGAAAVAALLGLLWALGLLSPAATSTATTGVRPLALPPDTNIETPRAGSLAVGLRPGELAPDFAFSGYLGERQRLSDFRGRMVVLNFWASWCSPCRAEMADLQAALSRYGPDRLAVLAVNNGESYSTGLAFLEREGIALTAFAVDTSGDIAERYRVRGMPSTYFIDCRGVVVAAIAGRIDTALIDATLAGAGAAGSCARG